MAGQPSQTTEPDQNKAEPRELSPSGSAQGTLALSLPLLTGKFFTTEPSAKPLALSLPTPPVCQQLPGAWRAPGGGGQVRDPGKEPSFPRKDGEDRGHGG